MCRRLIRRHQKNREPCNKYQEALYPRGLLFLACAIIMQPAWEAPDASQLGVYLGSMGACGSSQWPARYLMLERGR